VAFGNHTINTSKQKQLLHPKKKVWYWYLQQVIIELECIHQCHVIQ